MATYGSGTYGSGLFGSGSGGGSLSGSLADFGFSFEMATTSTPRTASPTWTDLSSFVMASDSITLTRGRGSEQEASAQPGRANVTLRNVDDRFTMGNGSSPYAPLQLRRPCRFRVAYDGVTYDRWYGFVDSWNNDRVETTGVARLSMSDRLARANKVVFPNAIEAEILRDSPVVLFPLQAGAQERDTWRSSYSASGAVYDLRINLAANVAIASDVSVDLGPDDTTQIAVTQLVSTVDGGYLTNTANATGFTGQSRTATAYVYLTASNTSDGLVMGGPGWSLRVDTAGIPYVNTANVSFAATGTQSLFDGKIHHVAVTAAYTGTNSTLQVFVDGVRVATATGADTTVLPSFALLTIMQNVSGRISHVAAYSGVLADARIADQAAALTSWSGETTIARFNRLCARAGLPSAWYTTTGTTAITTGPQPTAGVTLLGAIDEVAQVEKGAAFLSENGVLTFATSATRYNTAVGVTLDASTTILADEVDFRTDTDFLINSVTATRAGGSPQWASDATSIAAYDTAARQVALIADLDTVCLNWAQWTVASSKDPRPRCESVTVDVVAYARAGGDVAAFLTADVGTKLRLSGMPSDVYSSSTLDLFIEGVEDQISKDTYRIKFTTSPVALEDTVWVLGTDLLDVGTILGY